MLYPETLSIIRSNTNPGVEYEIALFFKLLSKDSSEANDVMRAISARLDSRKIMSIINVTNTVHLITALQQEGLIYTDVSFETQNDEVGPADVILYVRDKSGVKSKLGLSIKYNNRNTLNPTARKFLTEQQIESLQTKFDKIYIPRYIHEMKLKYGNVTNWKRKRSESADAFYDLLRDAVIQNWPNIPNKAALLSQMFHKNSPIPFWIIYYSNTGYIIKEPETIDESRVNEVIAEKYRDAFVAFKLDNKIIGKVQVKCNNGFIEDQFNHAGKAKKKEPDFILDGKPRIKGKPFGSWDFTLGS